MLISSIFWEVLIAILVRLCVCMRSCQESLQVADCCLELIPHLHGMTKGISARQRGALYMRLSSTVL